MTVLRQAILVVTSVLLAAYSENNMTTPTLHAHEGVCTSKIGRL